jgi:Holliday junction resolvase
MNLDVHRRLAELSAESDKEYGKLVQKLLGIAFLDAGADALTDRSTQGIDLELELDGVAYALEVKTTEGGKIRLGAKDVDGLAAREQGGARAYVAVLGSRLVDDWLFARFHPHELAPAQTYSVTQLRPYRDRRLERVVLDTFPRAVLAHVPVAVARGQKGLDEVLARHPRFRPA